MVSGYSSDFFEREDARRVVVGFAAVDLLRDVVFFSPPLSAFLVERVDARPVFGAAGDFVAVVDDLRRVAGLAFGSAVAASLLALLLASAAISALVAARCFAVTASAAFAAAAASRSGLRSEPITCAACGCSSPG